MDKRLPTIKEIARELNISVSTVSRALHNHHSIGLRTKSRVQELARKLNYEPNQTAIFFKQGKTFTIGVILPNLSESFFSSAISGIEDFAVTKKYNVLLGQSHDNADREKQIVETMKNHRVDGIIVSVSKNTVSYEHFETLKNYNIPIVFFDRIPAMPDIHYVACNLESGITEAVGFLINRKHKHIGLINGPKTMLATKERLDGFRNALKKYKLKADPSMVVSTDLSREGTWKAMQNLLALEKRPTAIIAFNDYVALDAIQYAKKAKVKINKDISFVSFANMPICSYMENPPLASVEQFPYLQGEKSAEMLLQLLDENKKDAPARVPYKIILDPKLEIHT
jgi:LacI family transcriptional regulator, repressor for deo operon, udp, cdd, tsx, nupC, and nupG